MEDTHAVAPGLLQSRRTTFPTESQASSHPIPRPDGIEMSYRACVPVFLLVATAVLLTPLKEYYLGNYVTKAFDEVRGDVVGRELHHLGVLTSGVHFFDTFDSPSIPIIDADTTTRLTRSHAASLSLSAFIVRANLRRADLLTHLPPELLNVAVNLMEDGYAPLCAPTAWTTQPQLLFGNWFPTIRHEFCRDFGSRFPHDRFFNYHEKTPVSRTLAHVGDVTLGLISVVNMSEIYLRHFDDVYVIRKIMKNVQEGLLGMELPSYTDAAADAIVGKYKKGMPLADVIELLPGSFDSDHISLVDLLGISSVLDFYLQPKQLTMGVNVNGEPAILAEVTSATTSYLTPDYLINTVGMHLISTMHLAPFWDCAIHHTTMDKKISTANVDATAMKHCGESRAAILPLFAVNLMFLFQKKERDYTKIDNSTTYTLAPQYSRDPNRVIPEVISESPLLSTDGSAWTKPNVDLPAPWAVSLPVTPYGYLFTPDCRNIVATVMQQSGRNVQKYQAYIGDGLGNCAFRDSQETPPQTLCRLWMRADQVVFTALNGSIVAIPECDSLVTPDATGEIQSLQQQNFRQIEFFSLDSTELTRRIRIQDNTSRQIRTFLLILDLIGACYFVAEFLIILKSVWIFVHNSLHRPFRLPPPRRSSTDAVVSVSEPRSSRLRLQQLLYFDPTVGAIRHPGTMALLYLGAVGALSNVFTFVCSANLSTSQNESSLVITCKPAIPFRSVTLLLTTLNSTYWVTQVALQTRTLAERLDHAANPTWYKNVLATAVGAVVVHFGCKAVVHVYLDNVQLRSDPHLYAVFGGVVLSWILVLVFLAINYKTTARRLRAAIMPFTNKKTRNKTKTSSRRSNRSLGSGELLVRDAQTRERSFLAKWGASELDDALHYCATSFIAQELQAFGQRQASRLGKAPVVGAYGNRATLPPIEIHEFVMVHCAGGAARYLETVAWQTRPGTNEVLLTTVRSQRRSKQRSR